MTEFDPLDPAFVADPYPFYHRLRAADPVHRHPLGFYVLTRYEDVAAFLRDPRLGRAGYEPLLAARFGSGGLAAMMLMKDPPDHTRLRTLVSRAFTPRVVETMRPHIQAIVDRLLDAVEPRGTMDVIADLAYPLPVTVISELLGVPAGDNTAIRQWSLDVARGLDAIAMPTDAAVVERGRAGYVALGEYFRSLTAERRRRPTADLLSGLIAAEEAGDRLSETELLATCVLLYVAGHETTVNLIGNGLLALLRHPAERARLAADPALLPGAVEELLRYDAPVQRTGRLATAELDIGGRQIEKGAMVLGLIGAANRDPAHFADPERLDLTRPDNRHLAFGLGIHFCLGAPLARLEGQLAIGTVLRRLPRLELAASALEWRAGATLRGLTRLPVAF